MVSKIVLLAILLTPSSKSHEQNHHKPDLRDLAVEVNKAVADETDESSKNEVGHGFFEASTDDPKKAAERKLQAIRTCERRKRDSA